MTRPDRHETAMRIAEIVAERSTCQRANGAVAAIQGRVVASGYNGAPAGLPHCDHTGDVCSCATNMLLGGTCLLHGTCQVSTHAEANLIAWAARHGIALMGSELYCTTSPCVGCARLIINAGIMGVWFRSEYRLTDGLNLLGRVGIPAGEV